MKFKIKYENYRRISLIAILCVQFLIGIYGINVAEDTPIHVEIIKIIIHNPFNPVSYDPLASISFTYPPLFHYFSYLFFILFSNPEMSIKVVGLLNFAIFPFLVYLVGRKINENTGIFSALFSIVSLNYTILFILGEFPEIFGFNLMILSFYFFLEERYYLSGIFLGMTLLSHPFLGPFSVFLFLSLFFIKRDKKMIKIFAMSLLISSVWMSRYYLIIINAIYGKWNNTVNYALNPGFLNITDSFDTLLRLNPFLFILSIYGLFVFITCIKKRGTTSSDINFVGLSIIFLITFLFTIYHYTPFQLKMQDILSFPMFIFSAFAANRLLEIYPKYKFHLIAIILLMVIVSVYIYPIKNIDKYSQRPYILPLGMGEAAVFLREYDSESSFIVVAEESRQLGKTELIVSQISDKKPVDAFISDLEYYTRSYRQRLVDRKGMINGDMNLIKKWNVKYVFSKNCKGNKIFENNMTRICKY